MKKGLLKKVFAVAMVGVMSLSLMACGSKEEEDMLSKIKKDGKITVGMSIDYAPYEFYVMENGEKSMAGLDIEIIKEIAKDLGVDYEIEEMEFGAICESVKNGMINIGVSGLTPTDERKEIIDFSDSYLAAEQGIIINKKNAGKIKSLNDLKGLKVGAQNGSIQAEIARGIEGGADLKLLAEVPTLIQDLNAGNLDAVIVELPVADIQAVVNPDLLVVEEKVQYEEGGNAIGLPKGQEALLKEINKTLKRLQEEGKIDQYYKDAVNKSKDEVTVE